MDKLEALVKQLKEGSAEGRIQTSSAGNQDSYKASCVATGRRFNDSCMSLGPFEESCLCIGKK